MVSGNRERDIMETTNMMKTEELLKTAQSSLDATENMSWVERDGLTDLVKLNMQDAQVRALIAIAIELKRMNDMKTVKGYVGVLSLKDEQ